MVQIRNLTEREREQSLSLGEFAFQFELSPEDRAKRLAAMKPHQIWGAFVGGELAAMCTILDLETWVHGVPFPMGGVAGVATWPEHRRQGLVAKLLAHGLKTMRANGQTVSFLAPFSFAFYRKYGWETYVEYKSYELKREQLPAVPPAPGRIRRVEQDSAALRAVYDAYARRFTGTLVRSEEWWSSRAFRSRKGQIAVYENERGEPRGYAFYRVKDRTLDVHEWAALDEEARLALWGLFRNHDSMIDTLKLDAPIDDALSFRLPDPRIKQEIVPYFMARIVDAAAFVAAYPFAATGAAAAVTLRVRDEHAPWNDGAFTLAVDGDGRGALAPASDGAASDGAISCGIGALAAMLMGYKRPAFVREAGLLDGSDEAVETLERLLPRRATYLMDFF